MTVTKQRKVVAGHSTPLQAIEAVSRDVGVRTRRKIAALKMVVAPAEVPGSNLRRLVAKATVITKLRDLCAVDVSRSHALEWPCPAYHAPLAQVQRAIRGLGAAQPILRDVFRRGDVTGGAWWHQCRDVSSDQRGRWNGAGRLP